MTAKTPTPPKTIPQLLYVASNAPGGFLPSEELDRANAFASKRIALEAAIEMPRDQVAQAVRVAVSGWTGMFTAHADDLARAADFADHIGRVRKLEAYVLDKVALFASGESGALIHAPKHLDRFQLHAAELARSSAAVADTHRVRHWNY